MKKKATLDEMEKWGTGIAAKQKNYQDCVDEIAKRLESCSQNS